MIEEECPDCNGSGNCYVCGGSGKDSKAFDVRCAM